MEQMIKLQIDRHTIEVAQGTTLLSAARSAGINIPTLCHLDMKDMCIKNARPPAGSVSWKSKAGKIWLRHALHAVKTA